MSDHLSDHLTASGASSAKLMPKGIRAVILDLDGTLLDTASDLAAAANAVRADFGLPSLSLDRVASFVGKGAESLMQRSLTDSLEGIVPEEKLKAALERFEHHYERENGRQAVLYPGVAQGLLDMKALGLRLACVTNKPYQFSIKLLEQKGLLADMEFVLGGDSLPKRKPDPMPILAACERFGLPPHQVLAIGDSINDALAARRAGVPVFAVPYGYNEGKGVESLDVDAIVATLQAAARLLK
jgi:phosphoglycolate phosphatase